MRFVFPKILGEFFMKLWVNLPDPMPTLDVSEFRRGTVYAHGGVVKPLTMSEMIHTLRFKCPEGCEVDSIGLMPTVGESSQKFVKRDFKIPAKILGYILEHHFEHLQKTGMEDSLVTIVTADGEHDVFGITQSHGWILSKRGSEFQEDSFLTSNNQQTSEKVL